MAVTTGKDTGTTSTGGASGSKSPDSGRGSGGPGGGSLSAPNRTDPSKGATASKAAPSSASGKTDKAPAASTSSKPSNPTGGSLSAPARTAPSSGITSRTPEQQKAVDKAKQNATQYGGAQTSTRAATAAKTPSSAKVTDPSRGGITSPMSGQGTSYKTPEKAATANQGIAARSGLAKDVANRLSGYSLPSRGVPQDPSIAGRAQQANANYKTTTGPGGLVSRDYADPDIQRTTLGDNVMSGLRGIGRGIKGAADAVGNYLSGPTPDGVDPSLPGRAASAKTLGQQLADAGAATLDKIAQGTTGFIDNLMSQPLMGEQPAAPTGPMTVSGSILSPNRVIGPQNMSQVVTGDYPKADFQRARSMSPTDRTPDQAAIDGLVSDPTNGMVTSSQAIANIQAAIAAARNPTTPAGKQIADRVPQENTPMPFSMPANPNRGLAGLNQQPAAPAGPAAPTMPDPRMAQMQEQFNRIAAGRNQPGKVAETNTTPPTGNDMTVEDMVQALTPQPTVPARQPMGQITNPMYRDPMAQANAVRAAVAMGLGERPQMVAPQPQNASQPMEIDIPGYPQQVAPSQEGLAGGNVFNRGQSPRDIIDAVNIASDKVRGVGDDVRQVVSPMPPSSGAEAISPSQDGNYPPDDNFLQDAGQPQDLGELSNRYDYEKAQVKQGLKELPGRLWAAITSGDIRGFTPETNDKRAVNPPSMNQRPQQPPPMSDADAVMVARLLALIKEIEQQGGSQAQADLVNSTFI